MPEHPESIVAGKKRPFTGAEFLESLRDGREVYIYGERVKDVTTHPAPRHRACDRAAFGATRRRGLRELRRACRCRQ